MFTDWTMQDHRYFYARGVIYGVVLATMFWKVFVPWLCERFRKPNVKAHRPSEPEANEGSVS